MIDRSGQWWTGTEAADLEEYLRSYTEEEYPATRFDQSRCSCGGEVFALDADDVEGCARQTCAACGLVHFVYDSGEVAADASLTGVTCPCGDREFEIVLGLSGRDDGTVRWLSVGVRCVSCGVLGCPVEWEID